MLKWSGVLRSQNQPTDMLVTTTTRHILGAVAYQSAIMETVCVFITKTLQVNLKQVSHCEVTCECGLYVGGYG